MVQRIRAATFHEQMTVEDLQVLMAQVAAGDRDAFARLYAATSAKLYGIVLRILRRPDLTDEVVQETYVRIWSHAASFDPAKASPITWMAAIARNRALDEVRRITPVSLEDMPSAFEIEDTAMLASETVELKSELVRLQQCLDTLEPARREIVKLAYLEGCSREELGQRFGHPVPTIKTWLHRSLKQLKTCLSS
jgi:RNA polymerase sigma-70 factor, ECF subfamily